MFFAGVLLPRDDVARGDPQVDVDPEASHGGEAERDQRRGRHRDQRRIQDPVRRRTSRIHQRTGLNDLTTCVFRKKNYFLSFFFVLNF